ncbi:MAG: hypothetical protein RQM90_03760 [Methanoculleus sp.]|nr:hypothetical protein [Methanomicrobiales archaeon]
MNADIMVFDQVPGPVEVVDPWGSAVSEEATRIRPADEARRFSVSRSIFSSYAARSTSS